MNTYVSISTHQFVFQFDELAIIFWLHSENDCHNGRINQPEQKKLYVRLRQAACVLFVVVPFYLVFVFRIALLLSQSIRYVVRIIVTRLPVAYSVAIFIFFIRLIGSLLVLLLLPHVTIQLFHVFRLTLHEHNMRVVCKFMDNTDTHTHTHTPSTHLHPAAQK